MEVPPATLFQGPHELFPFTLFGAGLDDFEFGAEAGVDIMVVFDVVADVENAELGGHFGGFSWIIFS